MSVLRKLLLATFVFAGCSSPQDSTGVGNPGLTAQELALIADGDDGTKTGDSASSIVSIPLLALDRVADLANETTAATKVETGTSPFFFPSACVSAARTAAQVTFTFNNCTGRLGLTGIRGQLTAKYAVTAPGEIGIDIATADGFSVDAFTRAGLVTVNVSLAANARISFDGATRRVRWNGNYLASVAEFRITQEPSYDLVVDTARGCVSLDGRAVTNRDQPGEIDTEIAGYVRCGPRNACPNPGGKVTYTRRADGAQLTIEFLGGTAAKVTGPRRQSIVVADLLECSPT